ncbi:dNTP triphosphohydrolase, broad substrate specificity [hydrothermal vent metagenome]|uniref:DNTP triphosphohydrolase, broad substrate specificity n=1 Tax=hydrothermal vent metagenome TaxID=652676 RepID=A0A3B0TY44_9ZZZZ
MKSPKLKQTSHLAPFASDPEQSRGRVFTTRPSLTRTVFQRDRDRIIHSTAFRRLQHKTQVFLHHEGLHYRTRLTHTLEVSQIARSLARALFLNEDLAEAIALAHDLGHTPFGHAGERALNQAMADSGGFDHNLQSLRTICMLENRYGDHDGLNLTWETLEGVLKHNGPVKFKPDLSFLPETLDLEIENFASLEAQVAAIADDIAYDAHDIDDAVRAGLVELSQLNDLPLLDEIIDEVDDRWPELDGVRKTHEVQRRLITKFIEDVIKNSASLLDSSGVKSPHDVARAGRQLIAFSPPMQKEEKLIKQFLFDNVYRAPSVMEPAEAGEHVVKELFEYYSISGDLPPEWQSKLEQKNPQNSRVIADYIAGMTDPFALAEFERVF